MVNSKLSHKFSSSVSRNPANWDQSGLFKAQGIAIVPVVQFKKIAIYIFIAILYYSILVLRFDIFSQNFGALRLKIVKAHVGDFFIAWDQITFEITTKYLLCRYILDVLTYTTA